jgi:hypothetical protein
MNRQIAPFVRDLLTKRARLALQILASLPLLLVEQLETKKAVYGRKKIRSQRTGQCSLNRRKWTQRWVNRMSLRAPGAQDARLRAARATYRATPEPRLGILDGLMQRRLLRLPCALRWPPHSALPESRARRSSTSVLQVLCTTNGPIFPGTTERAHLRRRFHKQHRFEDRILSGLSALY